MDMIMEGVSVTNLYTIKELAEARGTSWVVREALLALEAENIRLREALELCAKHVDWMPHPHCVEVGAAIRAALGDTK